MKFKEIAIGLFALALIGAVGFLWFSPSGLQAAPQVTYTTLDGSQLGPDRLKGKPTLVAFWATTCPGCIEEIPQLIELHQAYGAKGLNVIGVAMVYDPIKQVRQMVSERGMPYTIAHDTDGTIGEAFGGISLTPTTLLIDPQGRIAQKTLGALDLPALRGRIEQML